MDKSRVAIKQLLDTQVVMDGVKHQRADVPVIRMIVRIKNNNCTSQIAEQLSMKSIFDTVLK